MSNSVTEQGFSRVLGPATGNATSQYLNTPRTNRSCIGTPSTYLKGTHMKIFIAVVICLIASPVSAQSVGTSHQQRPEQGKSMQQLFDEDQADVPTAAKGSLAPLTFEQYNRRVKARMQEIRDRLAAGELKTGEDFFDAGLIFQHSDNADGYLFAHVLAMESLFRGYDRAKWLAATTLDRYLQAVKQPQVFGTQYSRDPKLPPLQADTRVIAFSGRTLEPYNIQLLSDSVRLDFCVPSLAQQEANLKIFETNKYPESTLRAPGCVR